MAANKYDKYIIEYDSKWFPEERRPVMARMQDSIMKGSHFYLIHWMMPDFISDMKMDWDFKYAGHPPHIHKDAELLFHIGTDPENPMDLGAEVIMYLGPELEEHHITRTCCIYIPPNFIHSPWKPVKTVRPWIFIEINQGPSHTEKSYRQILPKEAREKMDWSRWPDEGYTSPV
jgi:hypothetical protein